MKDTCRGFEINCTASRFLWEIIDLSNEKVSFILSDSFRECSSYDISFVAVPGNEEVHEGVTEVNGPGADLVPGPRGKVQSNACQCIF